MANTLKHAKQIYKKTKQKICQKDFEGPSQIDLKVMSLIGLDKYLKMHIFTKVLHCGETTLNEDSQFCRPVYFIHI